MIKLCKVWLLLLVLTSCTSSQVSQVNYYLLDQADASDAIPAMEDNKEAVVLDEVKLANYLKKSNLSIQLEEHRLYYSRDHLWAEPLHLAISRTLQKDLNQRSEDYYYISVKHPNSQHINRKLIVQFDHFAATSQSQAVISGKYWMVQEDKPEKTMERAFSISTPLVKDGFPHSVSRLRQLVTELSNEITRNLIQDG